MMVLFTVFIAMASATARFTPSWLNGYSVCILRQIYAGLVEHLDAERQVVGGERPGAQQIEVLGADAMPRGHDRAGVGELAHLDVGAAVAKELDAFRAGGRMAGAVHHHVCTVAADDVAHCLDALVGSLVFLDVDCGLGAELTRELEARAFWRADGDDAAGAHLLRRGDGEDADRPGALG